jgi:hypothetical protein
MRYPIMAATKRANPVMPVLDRVRDDGSGIQRQDWIPAPRSGRNELLRCLVITLRSVRGGEYEFT